MFAAILSASLLLAVVPAVNPGQARVAPVEETPVITAAEPAIIEAFTPVEISIAGSGFSAGARVFLQTSVGQRFLPYTPAEVSPTQIQVKFSAGFGLHPSVRALYVENPDGARSNSVSLQIVAKGSLEKSSGAETEPSPGDELAANLSSPELLEIQPARILMAQPVELLLLGKAFEPGAVVLLEVNINAGTATPPDYQIAEFPADYLGDSLLMLILDRGFAPQPDRRRIVVRNPDGGLSNELTLSIISPKEHENE